MAIENSNSDVTATMRYVAFCDVLGFSDAILHRFDDTIAVYADFMGRMRDWPFPEKAEISIYSDSILIVSDELPPVLGAVKNLWFAAMTQDWLIRGGVAYGKYWANRENGNTFVVSDALVRAARIESSVSYPAVALSPEIHLSHDYWAYRFANGILDCPLLHFRGLTVANPFNRYWFQSAKMRVSQLLAQFPEHSNKYTWLLDLADAVENDEPLVPEDRLEEMLKLGIIFRR